MSTWNAILLGLVQGLTEFLPISSSAHLRIVGELIGNADPGAAFTAITQIGTEAAVVLYYRKTIGAIIAAWWRALTRRDSAGIWGAQGSDARMGWYIILGSLPIGVLGLLFQDAIETKLRNLWITVTMLIVFGIVLGLADKFGSKKRELDTLTPGTAVGFGLAQALALVPGVSRSGGTISAGLFMGFSRKASADYAFLLAIPAVMASGFFQLFRSLGEPLPAGAPGWGGTIIATLVAFVVGYVVIIGFLKLISTKSYWGFVIYRIIFAIVVIGLLLAGVLNAASSISL